MFVPTMIAWTCENKSCEKIQLREWMMQVQTKHIFHCVVCGRVETITNEAEQLKCCGQTMVFVFKEQTVPVTRHNFPHEWFADECDLGQPSVGQQMANRFQA